MGNYEQLKTAISGVIKTNGNQEITGAVMQNALLTMINSLGKNYQFAGIATPTTNPGAPDQNVFYIAGEGTYVNFNNLVIDFGEIGCLIWDGSWAKQTLEVGSGGNMILEWNTDIATTRKQVVSKLREQGLQISYKLNNTDWINEQYIGTGFTDTSWSNDANWKRIAYRGDIGLLNVNAINDIVYTLETAVPAALSYMQANGIPRFKGLLITYKTNSAGTANWEIAQYCYDGTQNNDNFNRTNDGRWVKLPNQSSINDAINLAVLNSAKKSAFLNVNMYEDIVYTLETAVAKAYELVGAVKGIIIKYRTSANNTNPTVYETKRFTYGQTMNETNFKNLDNWEDYYVNVYDLTDKIEWENDYEDITDQKTADTPNVLINTNTGLVVSTGQGGGLYEYDVKPYQEFRFAVDNGIRGNNIFAGFYDKDDNPLIFKNNINTNGKGIYYAKAPIGSVKMRVRYFNTYIYVYRKKVYANELENNYNPQSINFDAITPLTSYYGEVATPIEVLENKKIHGDGYNISGKIDGQLIDDARCNLYKFSNGYYKVKSMGASFSACVAAYDVNDNLVKIVKGVGTFSNFYITPVPNAEYILVSSSEKENKVYNVSFETKKSVPNFDFYPIPNKTAELKVLTIGNSFSQDTWEYVPNILRQAGINDATTAYTFISGGTLEDYYNLMLSGASDTIRMNKSTNSADFGGIPADTYSLEQVLTSEVWDIVVLQQRSLGSYDFTTFEPYMSSLIGYIKNKVKNRKLCIMFNMVWSGEESYTRENENKRYNDIVQCTKEMIAQVGIPYVIPNGTAIQFGRKTEIQTTRNWTRDGYHADLGVGRYVLAATTFQYIYGYIYNKDVRDYTAFTTKNPTAVTAENINELNECAINAIDNRFIKEQIN